jgi:hypothetical protein
MGVLEVDRKGLAKQLANRPKAFILYELLQNAWDEKPSEVHVTIEKLEGRPAVRIVVEDDDPDGFQDLASAYTLFRASKKAPDPSKSGMFELGEKLIIAVASYVKIETTKGGIEVVGDTLTKLRRKRESGTRVEVEFRCNQQEFEDMLEHIGMISPPAHCKTYISCHGWVMGDSELVSPRETLFTASESLPTVYADEEGNFKRTKRNTTIKVYECRDYEEPHILCLGIPIVPAGGDLGRWHYDVQQRVPVNWERNNLPQSYVNSVKLAAINVGYARLNEEDAQKADVKVATADERIEKEALEHIKVKRYGEKAAIFDPSDPEANKRLVSEGYTLITGGAEPKGFFENNRTHDIVKAAGAISPSPKPYSENGRPERIIGDWNENMQRMAKFWELMGWKLIGRAIEVRYVKEPMVSWTANYGDATVTINLGRLGMKWAALPKKDPKVLRLVIHELAHERSGDHLSSEYHNGLTELGAKLANLALKQPDIFEG